MRSSLLIAWALCPALLVAGGCARKPVQTVVLARYSMDSMDGVIARSGVETDRDVTSDGGGSLHVHADTSATVALFETGDIDVEDARLTYAAKLRTENVAGKVYLEMWCHFPGRGEFFSRAAQSPLSGTQEWTSQETPFFLKKGENPDNVKLNLVVDGSGDVWIDDVRLVKGPLK